MYLNDLKIGDEAIIDKLNANSNIKARLMDMGLIKGTKITPIIKNPGGNMIAYQVRGTVIALRKDDTSEIKVYPI